VAEGQIVTQATKLYRRLDNECLAVARYGIYSMGYDLDICAQVVTLRDYGGMWAYARVASCYQEAIELLNEDDAGIDVTGKLYVKLSDLPVFIRFALATVLYG
jgi:hypothetical protein